MNSTMIMDDIRRRSIKLQRDRILETIRREEEWGDMSIPRRIIMDAELRAVERVESQGWKRNTTVVILVVAVVWLSIRWLHTKHATPWVLEAPGQTTGVEIETQTDYPPPKTVRFTREPIDMLREDYPQLWRGFVEGYSPPWLISEVSGKLAFDFYHPDEAIAVDYIDPSSNSFPNAIVGDDEIRFQNMIYDRACKLRLSREHGVDYVVLDRETNSFE